MYMFHLNEEGIKIPSIAVSDIEVFSFEILNRIISNTYYNIIQFWLLFIFHLFYIIYTKHMTEVKTGRGRPKQSTNVIEVNNIKL